MPNAHGGGKLLDNGEGLLELLVSHSPEESDFWRFKKFMYLNF